MDAVLSQTVTALSVIMKVKSCDTEHITFPGLYCLMSGTEEECLHLRAKCYASIHTRFCPFACFMLVKDV